MNKLDHEAHNSSQQRLAKQDSENFNLLKRVILLEERTRTFEESQVQFSFLEQRVDEIVQSLSQNLTTDRQRLIYDLEKKVIIIDDKMIDHDNKYNILMKSQPRNYQSEIDDMQEKLLKQERQCLQKWTTLREDMINQKKLNDINNEKQVVVEVVKEELIKPSARILSLNNETWRQQSSKSFDTKLLYNNHQDLTKKDLQQQQQQQKQQQDVSLFFEPTKVKSNLYPVTAMKQETSKSYYQFQPYDHYNVMKQQSKMKQNNVDDSEVKFEQTKRFIEEEISRRGKEEREKKNSEYKAQTYISMRDQLNQSYQKRT